MRDPEDPALWPRPGVRLARQLTLVGIVAFTAIAAGAETLVVVAASVGAAVVAGIWGRTRRGMGGGG